MFGADLHTTAISHHVLRPHARYLALSDGSETARIDTCNIRSP